MTGDLGAYLVEHPVVIAAIIIAVALLWHGTFTSK